MLTVVPVHFEHRDENTRSASAEVLIDVAADDTVLAAGDFNSTLPGMPKVHLDAEGSTAMARLRQSGRFTFPDNPETASNTFPAGNPDRCIDWILAPKGWQILEYRVIDTQLSDHRPVFARIAPPLQ